MDQTLLGLRQSWFNHFKKWIIQESVTTWENMVGINWKRTPPLASNMGGVWERQIRSARMILNSLLKTHGGSLTDESLQTLLVEVEAVVNSCPLPTETINDVTSLIPLSLINLLTMKSEIVMPPLGVFASRDKYCRKYWSRV